MKTILRWSPATLIAMMIIPAASFGRPIHATSRTRTNVIHDRSPRATTHETILHHS